VRIRLQPHRTTPSPGITGASTVRPAAVQALRLDAPNFNDKSPDGSAPSGGEGEHRVNTPRRSLILVPESENPSKPSD